MKGPIIFQIMAGINYKETEITAICSIYERQDGLYSVHVRYADEPRPGQTSFNCETLKEAQSYSVGDKIKVLA